jgi:hypothetical protein
VKNQRQLNHWSALSEHDINDRQNLAVARFQSKVPDACVIDHNLTPEAFCN